MSQPSLWDRLRRARLVQILLVYLGVSWIVLQGTETLMGLLELPEWVGPVALILLAIGLFVVLATAWVQSLPQTTAREEAGEVPTDWEVAPADVVTSLMSGKLPHLTWGRAILGGVVALSLLFGAAGVFVLVRGPVSLIGPQEAGADDVAIRRLGTGLDSQGGVPSEAAAGVTTEEAVDDRSIAVLPFADMSEGRDQEYFADGMTEELLAALSQVPALKVAARTTSFAFKDSGLDVSEIGRRIGVATVVEGSVRRSEDALRITAQLVDAETGFRLWSETYDRQLVDVFQVQEELAQAIARALRIELSPEGVALRGQTSSPEAQDAYLQGRFAWHRRTREDLEEAVGHFERAIELDPDYARAHVGLGDANAVLGFYDYRPPTEAFPAARRAAQRALEIESTLAEAHATLGAVALYHDWDWEDAESEFMRSIELDPEYPIAHQWYAAHLVAMGRRDAALAEMRRASELDPLSLIANASIGWVLLNAGENELAIAQLDGTLQRDPDFELAYLWRGQAYEALSQVDQAVPDLERAVELSGRSAITLTALSHGYATAGRRDEAVATLDEVLAGDPDRYVPSYEVARAYVGLGDHGAAVRWLERAFDERAHSMAFLKIDPLLTPLADDPGYQSLLDRMGLNGR